MGTTQENTSLRNKVTSVVKKAESMGMQVSIAARLSDSDTGFTYGLDNRFHPGSVIKLYMAACLLEMYDNGKWNPDTSYEIEPGDYHVGVGPISGAHIKSLSGWQLLYFSLANSDNVALYVLAKKISQSDFDNFLARHSLNATQATIVDTGAILELETSITDMVSVWNVIDGLSDRSQDFLKSACSTGPYTYFGLRYLPTRLVMSNAPVTSYAAKHGKLDHLATETLRLDVNNKTFLIAVTITNVPGKTFRNNVDNEGVLVLAHLVKYLFEFLAGQEFPIHSDFYDAAL